MVPKGDLEQFQRKQVHCIRQKLHEINKQDVFNDSIVIENALVFLKLGMCCEEITGIVASRLNRVAALGWWI